MKLKHVLFSLFALMLFSCEFDENSYKYNLGADFIDDPTRIIMVDTMSVNCYTTLTDSIYSSRSERLMAGRFQNQIGVITYCESYFRLDPTASFEITNESTVYDSACFILYLDGYHFGDTTQVCDLAIHQLTEEMAVNEDDDYIYNITNFSCETAPLATFHVDLSVDRHDEFKNEPDSVVIRIPDDVLGKKLFDYVLNEDTILDDKDLFTHQYKGFVIKPSNDKNSVVVGFSSAVDSTVTPKIRVYYHDNTPDDDLHFDYSLENFKDYTGSYYKAGSSDSRCYLSNYMVNDYSKSAFKDIQPGESELSSRKTGNVSILQAGIELRTKIEIPNIDYLYSLGTTGSIIKALLIFEPIEGSFSKKSDLPSSLQMYLVNEDNDTYGMLSYVSSSDIATAQLNYNETFKNESYYSFDITRFIRDEYMSTADPKYSLQLVLPQTSVHSNVNQLLIGDHLNNNNQMKLKIYMSSFLIEDE
ncbi:MAG TPA: DUF4270 family protein [Prolixibacteraceae bacterium]|nr:DUF4270 family protein [Prolixibacteraceae bacterium]